MKRIKLTVAYDGTHYCGWQIQKNGITVEQVLNETLSRLLGEDIHVIGASRTDAGVHALGNVAVYDTKSPIPGDKVAYALNQWLPEDISVVDSAEVPGDFHPRHHNSTKTYTYRILNTRHRVPVKRLYSYFYHRPLDMEAMNRAAAYLLGEHDFVSFCSAHAQVKETTRTLYQAAFHRERDELVFTVSGNGFLYNMVRIMVGTLIEVGTGKYPPEHVKDILDSRDRELAGPCAPPEGLTLAGIVYEEQLAPQLVVENDRMFYSLVQRDIRKKRCAYLNIFRCRREELDNLISRMAKKVYRLGADRLYVQCREYPRLDQVLGASKYSDAGNDKEYFTAGDYRFVFHHTVDRLDREFRADPPAELTGRQRALAVIPLETDADRKTYLEIYEKCFYSLPCSHSYSEEEIQALSEDPGQQVCLLRADGQTVGILHMEYVTLDDGEICPAISALGIIGEWGRKGWAGAAIERAAADAARQGYPRMTLQVASTNKKARQLYFKHGFYPITTKMWWYVAIDPVKNIVKSPQKSVDTQG